MSGIYIHIPFCKQACHYCDFHFSTQMKKKDAMVDALVREMEMRKSELGDEVIETIYFGGGTPSVLELQELERLIQAVYDHYKVIENPEITLEANPDDLSKNRIIQLSKSPVNRLSIGIQSFFEEDLTLMNRAHNAQEAENCIEEAVKHFDNITIDLIYGIPGMGHDRWKANIQKALDFGLPHISSYALTVEPKTALEKLIQKGTVPQVDDGQAQEQFHILVDVLEEQGFVNYEISNFGKSGYFSKNNTAYWQGKKYLGIGPSAHSYDGLFRAWNIRNNSIYIKQIQQGILPSEKETLTVTDRYNEYVMTGLRTIWGVSKEKITKEFGSDYANYLEQQSEKFIEQQLLFWEDALLRTTKQGKFLADGIAADLFFLE
ncbi:radical SAM family heme chaperone HemW [Flagellimonas aequoris]|uniref:Heme chaperone HemW n=1 Tax=Flagellimonas aequoris TaxID=2306997 RepID=A0A418NBK6_9FLAO|nr:radical SAM family heme chaperone HemW [Allomuricauda aequoris]RIV73682.1 radical SAM family heme chaperone HemW [Allomuricauda aequoris]TXK07366.1 radical SAM family heme chaperone HemW [Allomuricauda aequoris]